jgi:hypothetical protein
LSGVESLIVRPSRLSLSVSPLIAGKSGRGVPFGEDQIRHETPLLLRRSGIALKRGEKALRVVARTAVLSVIASCTRNSNRDCELHPRRYAGQA